MECRPAAGWLTAYIQGCRNVGHYLQCGGEEVSVRAGLLMTVGAVQRCVLADVFYFFVLLGWVEFG